MWTPAKCEYFHIRYISREISDELMIREKNYKYSATIEHILDNLKIYGNTYKEAHESIARNL